VEPTQYGLVLHFRLCYTTDQLTVPRVGGDIVLVPDWTAGSRDSNLQARAMLKERCDASRPLGLARSGEDELMVIYEGQNQLSLFLLYRI
jgi:hypothetical protein